MCDPMNPAAPETTMRKYPPKSPILANMTDASWMERSALIALMAASLALFWLRFRKVLEAIRGARATPDFEVAPLGPRIRQLLWEVVAQAKVIGQRPLPGLAHAFVFWGFCAFALVTVNHFASAFGARFLSGETAFGRFYLGFVAVWAVAVAVAMPACSSAASSCARCGSGSCRRNRASSRC